MKKIVLISMLLPGFILMSMGQELQKNIQNGHNGTILSVAVNDNADEILSSDALTRANLWNLKTGQRIKTLGGHSGEVTHVAFSPDNNRFLTTGADNKIIIWDINKSTPLRVLNEHQKAVLCAEFNPVNGNIASGSEDNTIIVWDGNNYRKLLTLNGHSKKVNDLSFSSDGKHLVSGSSDGKVIIWDANSGGLLKEIDSPSREVYAVDFSSDGRFVASGGKSGKVNIWDAGTGNKIAEFNEFGSSVYAVAFTPDVQYLAAAGDEGKIIFWNVEKKQMVKNFTPHNDVIHSLKFSNRDNIMVTAGADRNINIWDISNLNIGSKKYVDDGSKPQLTCSPLILNEQNKNGIIDISDSVSLNFIIKNDGKGRAYDVVAKVKLIPSVIDLMYDEEYYLGNLFSGESRNISIKVYPGPKMESKSGTFLVNVLEANGNDAAPQSLAFQTKGVANAFILIDDYDYSSATGKADIGLPITLKLLLKNVTATSAKNISIHYILPENVIAVDKLMETINEIPPNESKEVSVQFYANNLFNQDKIKLNVEFEGAVFSNIKNIDLSVKLNETLPSKNNTNTNINENNSSSSDVSQDKPLYRGDALQGIDIYSAQKEMEIGDFYALIIGIDNYSGHWPALQTAVNDAKTFEKTITDKYKIDYIKTLYNEQATRSNIIQEFEWLVANVKPKDNVLIYYSGHGDYKQELNKGYWVPVNAVSNSTTDYISNADIQIFLAGIKSKHTLLISDACFSGDILRGKTEIMPFENSDKYYQKINGLISRQAITSGGIEPVMDGGFEGHSVFAYYLLKALNSNSYKYYDAGQLYSKIRMPIINNSDQTPNLSPIKNTGDEGGHFIFVIKE